MGVAAHAPTPTAPKDADAEDALRPELLPGLGGGGAVGPSADGAELEAALRKVSRRMVPLCMAVSIMNHLDRSK
jgi:hypothetical protein